MRTHRRKCILDQARTSKSTCAHKRSSTRAHAHTRARTHAQRPALLVDASFWAEPDALAVADLLRLACPEAELARSLEDEHDGGTQVEVPDQIP